MRAVWYERTGAADAVLQVGDMPTPEPGAGQVRVRLMASGVNPADTYRRAGTSYAMEGPRVIPQSDGAGIVDKVGPGVGKVAVGDRIWLYNGQRNGRAFGTGAEFIALDADLVTKLPDNVPFEAGACLGIPCMTAHRGVFGAGPVSGQTVLVTGGAGAVGNYAVQLAKWGGARVIATVSNAQHAEDAKAGGADLVIDRRAADIAEQILAFTGGQGVGRAVEVDLGGNIDVLRRVVAVNGSVGYYATRGDLKPVFPSNDFMRRNIMLQGFVLPILPVEIRRQAQADIARWLDDAPRLHRIAGVYPLAETAAAHKAVEAGGKRGTVVVRPNA